MTILTICSTSVEIADGNIFCSPWKYAFKIVDRETKKSSGPIEINGK